MAAAAAQVTSDPLQIRSHVHGISHVPNIADALAAYDDDSSVWKISFDHKHVSYRLRAKVRSDVWSPSSELKIAALGSEKKTAHKVVWIDQTVLVNDAFFPPGNAKHRLAQGAGTVGIHEGHSGGTAYHHPGRPGRVPRSRTGPSDACSRGEN